MNPYRDFLGEKKFFFKLFAKIWKKGKMKALRSGDFVEEFKECKSVRSPILKQVDKVQNFWSKKKFSKKCVFLDPKFGL